MKPDECKGCASYGDLGDMCSGMITVIALRAKSITDISGCPCVSCLIKVMCTTPCQEFLTNKTRVVWRLKPDET